MERVPRVQAVANRPPVFLLEVSQLRPEFLQLLGDLRNLPIDPSGLQVMRQDAFPIGFLSVVERVPMPIGYEIGARSNIGIDGQPELTGIRRDLVFGVPAYGLGRRFGDQIIAL